MNMITLRPIHQKLSFNRTQVFSHLVRRIWQFLPGTWTSKTRTHLSKPQYNFSPSGLMHKLLAASTSSTLSIQILKKSNSNPSKKKKLFILLVVRSVGGWQSSFVSIPQMSWTAFRCASKKACVWIPWRHVRMPAVVIYDFTFFDPQRWWKFSGGTSLKGCLVAVVEISRQIE
jgi:hypothetical protein